MTLLHLFPSFWCCFIRVKNSIRASLDLSISILLLLCSLVCSIGEYYITGSLRSSLMAEVNNLQRDRVYIAGLDHPIDHIVLDLNQQQVHELMYSFYNLIALLHHVMQINNNNQQIPGNIVPNRNVQIPQLDPDRANPADGINNLLALYVGAQGAIFNAAFFVEGRRGCEILWYPLILSGLVSFAIIVAVLKIFFQQFIQLRDGNYWSWVAQKVAFIMMLISFSVCLELSCTSVLCVSGS